MTEVHVVVPDGIDDPRRPSGGNVYDRQVCRGLAATGWSVHEHAVAGCWPQPDAASFAALAARRGADPRRRGRAARRAGRLDRPRGAGAAGEPAAAGRARAHAVRRRHRRRPDRRRRGARARGPPRSQRPSSRPARGPGAGCSSCTRCRPTGCTSPSPASTPPASRAGTAGGGALLCVAAVTPRKGHDVLLEALATIVRPALALRVRRQPRPRPGVRRAALRRRALARRSERPRALRRAAHRSRSRPPATPPPTCWCSLARRDVRHGRHRGPGPRAAGRRGRGRRAAGGARPRRRRDPARACSSRPATRRRSPPRSGRWLTDAELRDRLRRAARERRAALAGWPATTAAVAERPAGAA